MRKSIIALITLLAILSLTLTACPSGSATPTTTPPTIQPTTSPPTTSPPTTTEPTMSEPTTVPESTVMPEPPTTGTIKGILLSKETGQPVSDISVFLAVLPTEEDLLIQLYEDTRWESMVGSHGEELCEEILKYVEELNEEETLDTIYVVPFVPAGEKNEVCEMFAAQTGLTGGFSFTAIPPGVYYLICGAPYDPSDNSLGFPTYKCPAGATGVVGNSALIFIEGLAVAYITLGDVEGGLLELKSNQTLDVGSIQFVSLPRNRLSDH